MRILQIAALALLLSSCLTDAKLKRKAFERGICGTSKDSIRVRDSVAIHYKDTVISHPEKQGEEISFDFGDNCDSLRSLLAAIQKNPLVKKKNGLTETVSSNGKNLQFICREDAYKDSLRNAKEERDFWHFQSENNTKIIYKDAPETWKQVLYRRGFWWMLFILLSIGIWKTRNLWLHLIFPKI